MGSALPGRCRLLHLSHISLGRYHHIVEGAIGVGTSGLACKRAESITAKPQLPCIGSPTPICVCKGAPE